MDLRENIKSQYLASLEMMRQAMIKCPEDLWADQQYKNAFWRVAYHALFYIHLYLQSGSQVFTPWAKHKPGYNDMVSGGEPYSKSEMLEYLEICRQKVVDQVAALDLSAPSGFDWLPFNRLEVHFYNLRHLQQHIGELCERLGSAGEIEVDWS